MTTRSQLIAEAKSWIGTRYQHQACLKGVACDCIGLIAGVAKAVGLPEASQYLATQEFRNYGRRPDPVMLLKAVRTFLDPVEGPPLPGDILLMTFARDPQHFAIVTSLTPAMTIVHSYAPRRQVCEHSMDAWWADKIVGVYAYRGIA